MRQPSNNHFVGARRNKWLGLSANLAITVIAAVAVLLSMTLGCAAATQVQGQQDDLQIHLQNATIREVLDALSARFKLSYKLPPNIGNDRTLSGLYFGNLHQVLAHILDGHDYIARLSGGDVEVVVIAKSGTIVNESGNQAVIGSENRIPPGPSTPVAASKPISPSSNSLPPPLSAYLSAHGPTAAGRRANP
jgi:hypothetical protein